MGLPDLPFFAPPVKASGSKNGFGTSAHRDVMGRGKASATIVLDSGSESDEPQGGAASGGEYEEHEEGGTEDDEALARVRTAFSCSRDPGARVWADRDDAPRAARPGAPRHRPADL